MNLRIATVGELSLDDFIYEDDLCHWKQPGGGALYSALGAHVWGVDVAIISTVGADYPNQLLKSLTDAGIDISGIRRVQSQSLGLWLLYESGGRRHQIEKASGSTFSELDGARPHLSEISGNIQGVHVAPQTEWAQRQTIVEAIQMGVPVTQDLLIEPFIDAEAYRSGEAMVGTTVFLPSEQEVHQLWGAIETDALYDDLRAKVDLQMLVVKRGAAGADVATPKGVRRVPAFSMDVVDTTGAGDAFCGGFLVGLLQTGNAVDAAMHGAVSASFIVETTNAFEALESVNTQEARRRLQEIRKML